MGKFFSHKVNKIYKIVFLLILQVHIAIAEGPETVSMSKKSEELRWTGKAWENMKGPVTTDARYYALAGIGLTTVMLIFEDQIIDPLQSDTVEDKPLGTYSKYGDLAGRGTPNALYIAGMMGYGLLSTDQDGKDNAAGMLQATAYSLALSTALKYTISEKRPGTNARDSFPSGHTTSVFSFASYVGCRHSWPWGIAAYSLAGFVGYSRINDNRHYLHDVLAGATIGGAFGIGVCLAENSRSERQTKQQSNVTSSWFVAPTDGGLSGGLSLRY